MKKEDGVVFVHRTGGRRNAASGKERTKWTMKLTNGGPNSYPRVPFCRPINYLKRPRLEKQRGRVDTHINACKMDDGITRAPRIQSLFANASLVLIRRCMHNRAGCPRLLARFPSFMDTLVLWPDSMIMESLLDSQRKGDTRKLGVFPRFLRKYYFNVTIRTIGLWNIWIILNYIFINETYFL